MPQIIIIDEIGTELEVLAIQTIAEKGVRLIGTTHGNCLANLIKNPSLVNLIGGIQYVTLSDEEAKRRKTQKSILERKSVPTFEILIELENLDSWSIHEDVYRSVDFVLLNSFQLIQTRTTFLTERFQLKCKRFSLITHLFSSRSVSFRQLTSTSKSRLISNSQKSQQLGNQLIIYPYSLAPQLLQEVLSRLNVKCVLTNNIRQAHLIIGMKKHLRQNLKLKKVAMKKKIPIYSLNKISLYQLAKLFYKIQY